MTAHALTEFDYEGRTYVIAGYGETGHVLKRDQENTTFFERETLEFISTRRLRGTYLDVGANVGNHALFFLTQTECQELIAVEGNAEIIPILESNLSRNLSSDSRYTVVARFISDKEKVFFNRDRAGNIESSFVTYLQLGTDSTEVPACRLDDTVDHSAIPSFLKLDVGGHEIEVLKSATRILACHQPEICVDVLSTLADDISAFLRSFGYLPLAAFAEGNLYYVGFPQWLIVVINAMAKLPSPLSTRIGWRTVRLYAALTGRLPWSLYKKNIPSYRTAFSSATQ